MDHTSITESPDIVDTPEILPPEEEGGNAATANHKPGTFRIGRDLVIAAIREMPEGDGRLLMWLWNYCNVRQLSLDKMEALLKKKNSRDFYSYNSIYQILSGRRASAGVNVKPILESIAQLKADIESDAPSTGFIESDEALAILKYIDKVRRKKRIGFIVGNMAIGKSTGQQEAERRNYQNFYFRTPTRGQLAATMQVMARRYGMGHTLTLLKLRNNLFDAITTDSLLMFDDVDQCFNSFSNELGLSTIDMIREIYDKRNCPIVLAMDYHGWQQFINGPHSRRLRRIFRRRIPPLCLPNVPSDRSLGLYAASVGLPEAPNEEITANVEYLTPAGKVVRERMKKNPLELFRSVAAEHGLFILFDLLQDAADLARESRKAVTWGAFIMAYAQFFAGETELAKIQQGGLR